MLTRNDQVFDEVASAIKAQRKRPVIRNAIADLTTAHYVSRKAKVSIDIVV